MHSAVTLDALPGPYPIDRPIRMPIVVQKNHLDVAGGAGAAFDAGAYLAIGSMTASEEDCPSRRCSMTADADEKVQRPDRQHAVEATLLNFMLVRAL